MMGRDETNRTSDDIGELNRRLAQLNARIADFSVDFDDRMSQFSEATERANDAADTVMESISQQSSRRRRGSLQWYGELDDGQPVCPWCGRVCRSNAGIANHMRHCRQWDWDKDDYIGYE